MCTYDLAVDVPAHSAVVASDDVFDFMLDLRAVNGTIDEKRERLFKEHLENKYASFCMTPLEDYEKAQKGDERPQQDAVEIR